VSEERFRDPKLTINRVYTRTGDGGLTRLVGGQQVPKDALRIDCYGTVDTLNAHVGAARVSCLEAGLEALAGELLGVQHALFNLGSILATLPSDVHPKQPRVTGDDVDALEKSIDAHNEHLPTLRSFVLPGGHRANTDLHLARTVCRAAERLAVTLDREEPLDAWVVPYLNRLSDALFVWSRTAAVDSAADEVFWDPNAT
jgi:cob(I)alamin adenosyltransferase